MPRYCVNKKIQSKEDGGNYEVHQTEPVPCNHLPREENQVDLGEHSNCHLAIEEARKTLGDSNKGHLVLAQRVNLNKNPSLVNGCRWCCTECHTE